MKPFNLERALAGDPVMTRDGRPVTQLTFFKDAMGDTIAGILEGYIELWREDGYYHTMDRGDKDLFMAPKTKEGWINIYQTTTGGWRAFGPVYGTEQEAVDHNRGAVPPPESNGRCHEH